MCSLISLYVDDPEGPPSRLLGDVDAEGPPSRLFGDVVDAEGPPPRGRPVKTSRRTRGPPSMSASDDLAAPWKARSGLPISINWTFFATCYGWGATSEYRLEIGVFLQRIQFGPKIHVKGLVPTNHSFCQKTRMNDVLRVVKMCA